jgi:hypothetical protein
MGPLVVRRSDRDGTVAKVLLVLFLCVGAGSAAAQEYVGPSRCFGCHKMGKTAWQASHERTLAQLSDPKAAGYAKSLGGDPKHPKCLVCHAPVKLAAGPATVSCESCHGPGKGWLNPHKEAAFYTQPARLGMIDLYKQANVIAKICVDCHVLNDKAMAADGHPIGGDFDAGRDLSVPKMVHWPSGTVGEGRVRAYDKAFYASVSGAGRPMVASRAGAAGGPGKPPAGKPPVAGPAPGGPAPVKPGGPGPKPTKPAAPVAAASDEYTDLGDEEFLNTTPGGEPPPPPAGGTAEAPAAAAAPPAAPAVARPIERLDIPDETTGTYAAPPVSAPRPIAAAPAATPAPGATPPPPPAPRVARTPTELRGRAAVLLGEMIRQKKKLPLPEPAPAAEFTGPDGELLHLQDAILALALETLRKNP